MKPFITISVKTEQPNGDAAETQISFGFRETDLRFGCELNHAKFGSYDVDIEPLKAQMDAVDTNQQRCLDAVAEVLKAVCQRHSDYLHERRVGYLIADGADVKESE